MRSSNQIKIKERKNIEKENSNIGTDSKIEKYSNIGSNSNKENDSDPEINLNMENFDQLDENIRLDAVRHFFSEPVPLAGAVFVVEPHSTSLSLALRSTSGGIGWGPW